MPASKAQQKAVNKYVKANYDLYQIKMPKGRKEIIKAHAAAQGESVNSFINRAIDQTMAQEAVGSPTRPAPSKMTLDITEGGNDVLGHPEGRTEGIAEEQAE